MAEKLKAFSTIGCCGIDCGLCPRFYTQGHSVCPGCGGEGFREKHPACGVLSCCAGKHGLEVCSQCHEYPCARYHPDQPDYDSFVTHRKVSDNLNDIRNNGIEDFLCRQKMRMDTLNELLNFFDDGRSKSFFCLACALLPQDKLQEVIVELRNDDDPMATGQRNKEIKDRFRILAQQAGTELKLNRKANHHKGGSKDSTTG